MNTKIKILIGILGIVIVGGMVWLILQGQTVNINTDKKEYRAGEVLKIGIRNNLLASICFSSCYPYYFERRDGVWEAYPYQDCEDSNIAKDCISLRRVKAFEIILPQIKDGIHRITIPVCKDCKSGEPFKEDGIFYSNVFEVR